MTRISIYTEIEYGEQEFEGWFDLDAATNIGSFAKGDPYKYGCILMSTASGKLIVNEWNNSGMNIYRFAEDEAEIAEILSEGGYDDGKKQFNDILKKYEL